jgi:CrcB protein
VTAVTALLVALGAAVGAPARYLTDRALQATHATGFPWGTLTVNVVASFVLGLVVGGPAPSAVVAGVGVGFCGGLSTWSTLGYETVRLAEDGERTAAVLNVVVSTLAGLGAAGAGLVLGAALWS